MKNVLFVASEGTPFVKTGGLADVIGSLPQQLKQNEQADVQVVLPYYDEIPDIWKEKMNYVASFNVKVGWRNQEASVYTLTHQSIVYYFIANDYYFTRKGIYGYYDDGERFIFFSHAVIEAIVQLGLKPDILHAHDWQAGFAVALANILQPVPHMKTVFTIHNIKYQGMIPLAAYEDFFRIGREHIAGMEWNGMLNALKSAIFHADKITTVSPTYAEEIMHPYYSEGLHPVLQERKEDVAGILNGIDQDEYNPMKDPHLTVRYRTSRSKKDENRRDLQESIGLPYKPGAPLYIIVSRLVEQKGLYLVRRIMEEFLQEDVQFIVLGTGDQEFEDYFRYLEHYYPDKVKALITFDEGLARRLYAAADFLLMPSKFEPCGLSQLIALQYKTVPIVRETGGLIDTVKPFNEQTGEGNGFSFSNYNAHELLHILRYSLIVFKDEQKWQQLIKNVNSSGFGWQESAKLYNELYCEIAAVKEYV